MQRRLILTRSIDEGVTLDVNGVRIRVFVANIQQGHKVRLGFEAPDEVEIWRDELSYNRDQGVTHKHVPKKPKEDK